MEDSERSLIEAANMAAKRIEEANKISEALIIRQEKIEARRLLGGQAEAGVPRAPEVSPEDKVKADMKNYFKGTAIEKALQ